MIERPIIFSGPMVRAICEGRKTQTRRVLKLVTNGAIPHIPPRSPYGCPGDRLYVRESFCIGYPTDGGYSAIPWTGADPQQDGKVFYRAAGEEPPDEPQRPWRPSIHMPRWASRITLEVTSVRLQRLQDITPDDAIAEGVTFPRCGCEVCATTSRLCTADQSIAIETFRDLWESINAKRGYGWMVNPFVWVIEFARLA